MSSSSSPSTSSLASGSDPLPPSRIAPSVTPPPPPAAQGKDGEGASGRGGNAVMGTLGRLTSGQMPCAKSSLLTGIASGVGIAGISLLSGRKARAAGNWGVGAWAFVSLASWETCRRNRASEKARMQTIIHQHNRKASGQRPAPPSALSSADSVS